MPQRRVTDRGSREVHAKELGSPAFLAFVDKRQVVFGELFDRQRSVLRSWNNLGQQGPELGYTRRRF